ncbi:MAG TPA: YihY/virulence factor BrkB family protein [Gaiellaceae bacterium]|nr:YihY/virulence factor BrkB family protein [Gaiellaceae bacterium]
MARSRRRHGHRQSFGELVDLWVDLFKQHNLLTYASAIAFQSLVALVALLLLGLAVLGSIGRTDVWNEQIAPHIATKVLPPVYAGIDAIAQKVFSSSSVGLIVFASVVTVWEMSGVVRACMGAIAEIYDTEEDRSWKIRIPLSLGVGFVLTASIVGSVLLATVAKGAVNGAWGVPWAALRWLLAVVSIAIGFGTLVRFAPVQPRTTRWASAGTTVVVVAWIAQALIFGVYLRYVANYTTAVGSLLGVYVLTTFLYVAAIILLVGIDLDEQLRKDLQGQEERGILEIVRDVV